MQPSFAAESQVEDLIYQFAAAPAGRKKSGPIFAARVSGLYVSEDEGATWALAYESLNLPESLATLAVIALPDGVVVAGFNGGLLRSTDGGKQWENTPFAEPQPAIVALAYAEDGSVFAGTLEDGVLYSTNFGEDWQTGNIGLIDSNVLCLGVSPNFKNDSTVWAGTQSGLFCSRNGGRAWREVELPMGYEAVISLAHVDDGTLFVGTETQGLWRSTDKGKTWERLGAKALTGAINQIVVTPDFAETARMLVVAEDGVWLSEDGGKQWQAAALEDKSVTTVLAPRGLGAGATVLVGVEGGETVRIRL
jgi:photosystem II stability/assembly factor-like uncharacterized protein